MTLQDIFVNRAIVETVHLSHVARTVRALALHSIKCWLRSINVRHRVVGVHTRSSSRVQVSRPKVDRLAVNAHVHHCLRTLECTAKVVQMFALELVLNSFPIGCVPNQR